MEIGKPKEPFIAGEKTNKFGQKEVIVGYKPKGQGETEGVKDPASLQEPSHSGGTKSRVYKLENGGQNENWRVRSNPGKNTREKWYRNGRKGDSIKRMPGDEGLDEAA